MAPPDGRTAVDRLLDELTRRPGADARPLVDRHAEGLDPDAMAAALRPHLDDLGGPTGEAALRVVEAVGTAPLLEALAEALAGQPNPPVDRLWRALELLEDAGRIDERPALVELRGELIEAIDGDDASLEGLIDEIEEDPAEVWIALHGLAEIEPDVRAEIVGELGGGGPLGPGTAELLRLLAYAHDPSLRAAALRVLEDDPPGFGVPVDDPHRRRARLDLAHHHPDPLVAARMRDLAGGPSATEAAPPEVWGPPRVVGSLVTGLDGRGRGHVAIVVEDRRRGVRVASAFACDVAEGVVGVAGRLAAPGDSGSTDAFLGELRERADRDAVEDVPALAVGLLGGALTLCTPSTSPALRYWLEAIAGPGGLRPRPFGGLDPDGYDPATAPPFEEIPDRASAVLDACPAWIDDSDLTYDLAEEVMLRWPDAPPDPTRDAGAYRYLFEHRLRDQLELYRRMLSWMGWTWRAAGAAELSRSALTLAWQLADPQHAVPAHPFTAELTTRSLSAAIANLRRGLDLRDPAARALFEATASP